jgi:hypothetical protein
MATTRCRIMVAAILVVTSAVIAGRAQQGSGMRMSMYDKSTEITVKGEVTDVSTQTGHHGMSGVHITVKGDTGSIAVHLGPAAFLEEQHLVIAKGDIVEVVGSKVKMADGEAVLARTVKKGETVTVLRDENGMPKWAGMRRGGS